MIIGVYGDNAYIEFTLLELWGFPDSICYSGGYDGKWEINIKSGNYMVKDIAYLSTGELIKLNDDLNAIYRNCFGTAKLLLLDTDLEVNLDMNNKGQINVTGLYKAHPEVNNKLDFEFNSNQSYLIRTFDQIEEMINLYGGTKGVIS